MGSIAPQERGEMSGKKVLIIVIVSVLAALVVAAFVLTGILLGAPRSDPQYVAHRGDSASFPGNTAAAFRAAADKPFYGIETDIRKTKDGVFVCNHDATVTFAGGEEKVVSDSTYAELASKPLKNDLTQEDAYLCTFDEYLEICKSGGKVAVIELKEDFPLEDIRAILAAVDVLYDRESISVITYYMDALLRVKAEDASIPLQYLSETKGDAQFERCLQEGISIDVKQNVLTSRLVKDFHAKGLTVNVWTINKRLDLTIARIKKADYITTDIFYED